MLSMLYKSCSLPVGSKSMKNTCDSAHFLVKLHDEDWQKKKIKKNLYGPFLRMVQLPQG